MASMQLLHKTRWDALNADIIIDNKPQTLNLSAFHAARKAKTWKAERDIIHFGFSDGDAGYIAEIGHTLDFAKIAAASISVAAYFKKHDFKNASAALHLFFYDDQDQVILKHRLACNDGMAEEQYRVPAQAQKLCFSLRLSGSGYFSIPSLSVKRDTTQKANRVQSVQKKVASALIRDRQYHAAIKILDSNNDNDRVLLIKCYTALHLFEQVAATFEALSLQTQTNTAARIHYLRALANLGEADKARQLIEASVMNLYTRRSDVDFLAAAYPFATFLSRQLAQMVRGRILASAQYLKKDNLNQILRCVHDLLSEQRFEEFYRLCDMLSAMDLSREDQARLHVLSAQAFYMLGRPVQKLASLNKAFAAFSLKSLALRKEQKPLTHRNIVCPSAVARSIRGPLVSIIMTTYNSAETVFYALTSLMKQTYADLEILVVDDMSNDKTQRIVQRLAKIDPRITLIPLERNGGTYIAKNTALAIAKGDYVTCHDSDDWAHPQKIEYTLAALLNDPKLIAAASQHVRYDPKRGFRGRNGYIQMDAPSLMYRKKDVLERVGYYDCVRAGADTEHQYRIERVFGRGSIRYLPDLLTLFLWSETSLTGGGIFAIDDDAGIFSKPRSDYRKAYMQWHAENEMPFIPFPQTMRPFPIPPEMMP